MTKGDDDSIISLEEAVEALQRSGYLLEDRLDTFLRAREYRTVPNAPYPDPATGKSRELDLVAYGMKLVPLPTPPYGVVNQLLIECVNNPQPIAFLTKERQWQGLGTGLQFYPTNMSFKPKPQNRETGRYDAEPATRVLQLEEYHHYAQGRIATQYCTFHRKAISRGRKGVKGESADEWMAWHDEHHFDVFRKLCDAVDHFHGAFGKNRGRHTVIFCYPVVVLQGQLLEVRQVEGGLTVEPVSHIRFRQSLHRGEKQANYQLDVVTEESLPELLKLLDHTDDEVLSRLDAGLAPYRAHWNTTE